MRKRHPLKILRTYFRCASLKTKAHPRQLAEGIRCNHPGCYQGRQTLPSAAPHGGSAVGMASRGSTGSTGSGPGRWHQWLSGLVALQWRGRVLAPVGWGGGRGRGGGGGGIALACCRRWVLRLQMPSQFPSGHPARPDVTGGGGPGCMQGGTTAWQKKDHHVRCYRMVLQTLHMM